MKTIQFKSVPVNWWKEFIGLKCNTVRKLDGGDSRLEILNDFIKSPFHLNISIVNTETQDLFVRTVKDVTIFDGYYIISW